LRLLYYLTSGISAFLTVDSRSTISTQQSTMCLYTHIRFSCGHLRHLVQSFCSDYWQTWKLCPPPPTYIPIGSDKNKCGLSCTRIPDEYPTSCIASGNADGILARVGILASYYREHSLANMMSRIRTQINIQVLCSLYLEASHLSKYLANEAQPPHYETPIAATKGHKLLTSVPPKAHPP
jgi:hypothetical protein